MVFERCIQLPVTWSHAGKKASCILEIWGSDSTKRSVWAISLKQFNQPSVSVRGMFELRTLHSEHSTSVSCCRYNSHLSSHTSSYTTIHHLFPTTHLTPLASHHSSHLDWCCSSAAVLLSMCIRAEPEQRVVLRTLRNRSVWMKWWTDVFITLCHRVLDVALDFALGIACFDRSTGWMLRSSDSFDRCQVGDWDILRQSWESLTRNALTCVSDRVLNVLLDFALFRGSFDSFKTLERSLNSTSICSVLHDKLFF